MRINNPNIPNNNLINFLFKKTEGSPPIAGRIFFHNLFKNKFFVFDGVEWKDYTGKIKIIK